MSEPPINGMQLTRLRRAADAERCRTVDKVSIATRAPVA